MQSHHRNGLRTLLNNINTLIKQSDTDITELTLILSCSSDLQVTELESVLEEEKRQRSQALAARRRLEGQLKEQEDLTEATSRGREETLKQLRKTQVAWTQTF